MVNTEGLWNAIMKNKTIQLIVAVAVVLIALFLIIALTDIDEEVAKNWDKYSTNFVVIALIIAIILLYVKPSLSAPKDPMEVLAEACKNSEWFTKKGYTIENIRKDVLFVESGRDCYLFYLRRANSNILEYVRIIYTPKVVVTDHLDMPFSNIDKRKKLGVELSTDDIKSAIERGKLEEQVREE